MLNITRSTSRYSIKTFLRQWAISIRHALNPFPLLPGVAHPWEETDVCIAVIRGGRSRYSATAALAYAGPDGSAHLELFSSNTLQGQTAQAAVTARIDALERIVQNPTSAAATRLYIDDPFLRAEVAASLASFPSLELLDAPFEGLSLNAAQAVTRANSTSASTRKRDASTGTRLDKDRVLGGSTHLVIATDASIVPGQPGAGISAVASDGTVWQEVLPETCDITWAELKAIYTAVAVSSGHPHVVILSDSQSAVAIATGSVIPTQERMRRLANQLQTLRKGRDVNISWVRAHRGHYLNEAADAMARQARRLKSAA